MPPSLRPEVNSVCVSVTHSTPKIAEDRCLKTNLSEIFNSTVDQAKARNKESRTEENGSKHKNTQRVGETPKARRRSESFDSNIEVIINLGNAKCFKEAHKSTKSAGKRKADQSTINVEENSPPHKKRRIPIVFDLDKKDKEVTTQCNTEGIRSDNQVPTTNKTKYDALPALQSYFPHVATKFRSPYKWQAAGFRKFPKCKPAWCRAFPLCRYGAACAFTHPRCKFAAACARRGCAYSHTEDSPASIASIATRAPTISSYVVQAANYKPIKASAIPSVCKYYPSCSNPVCSFLHPKACRYGVACLMKRQCKFYHREEPSKGRYPV